MFIWLSCGNRLSMLYTVLVQSNMWMTLYWYIGILVYAFWIVVRVCKYLMSNGGLRDCTRKCGMHERVSH